MSMVDVPWWSDHLFGEQLYGHPYLYAVEGANIMSRNLLIFGQGSMACHPYLREEFYALSMITMRPSINWFGSTSSIS